MIPSFSSTVSALTVCNIITVFTRVLGAIFSLEMVKKDICLGSASKQMPFSDESAPKIAPMSLTSTKDAGRIDFTKKLKVGNLIRKLV